VVQPIDESLAKLIDEKDFQKLLQREIQGLLRIHNFLQGQSGAPTMKRFYSCLMEEARELKNFLDDFDARNNRQYAFLTELILSLVSFSALGYLVRHVLMRYPRYHLRDSREHFIEYHKMAEELLEFCHGTLRGLFDAARREAVEVLGIRPPADKVDEGSFSDLLPRMHLPHTVDEREAEPEPAGGEVPLIATGFLQFADQLDELTVDKELRPGAMKEFLEQHCSEDRVRNWEAQIHQIQRKYDTLAKGTGLETRELGLRALRGHISMVLHHLEMLRYQVHYIEHLRRGIRYRVAHSRLEEFIDWDDLVGHTYRFSFAMTLHYVSQGKEIAKALLSKYTNVLEYRLAVPDGLSLHARPASLIVGIVQHHGTPVSMKVGPSSCDAGSMIQVMMALGSHSAEREVTFRGDEKPLADLRLLFDHRLGEDGLDGLPTQLAYLGA